jgi:hypothetical protein
MVVELIRGQVVWKGRGCVHVGFLSVARNSGPELNDTCHGPEFVEGAVEAETEGVFLIVFGDEARALFLV